jgi:hypothetical protein
MMKLLDRIAHSNRDPQRTMMALRLINERLRRELAQLQFGSDLKLSQEDTLVPSSEAEKQSAESASAFPAPKLFALYRDIRPLVYAIESDICTIGRSTACHIVVPLNTISRLHAKIERDGPHYMLYDTNSANGTFVNGHQIHEPHLLKDKDLIGLSAATALLRFEEEPGPTTSFEQPDPTIPFDEVSATAPSREPDTTTGFAPVSPRQTRPI